MSRKSNDCLIAVEAELERNGIPYEVRVTRKHIHIHYANTMSVVPVSPSCSRAWLNARADVRRKLRSLGLVKEAHQ